MKSPTRTAHVLLGAPAWRTILARIERHRGILARIRAALPQELAAHCQDCLLKERRLIVFVDDPLWCFQIRFHLPELRERLNGGGVEQIEDVLVRSLMNQTVVAAGPVRRGPGLDAVEAMRSCASVAGSREVAEALARLAEAMARKSV